VRHARVGGHVAGRAFTLVELLVVIGIVAVLISILLPALSRARQSGYTVKCLSNLRQLGTATVMYVNDHKQWLPYPTSTHGEQMLWYTALDRYLQDVVSNNRTGVARERSYSAYKQCQVWDTFGRGAGTGNQDELKEWARTYKMNSHLRAIVPERPNPSDATKKTYRWNARATMVSEPARTVMYGDGTSFDTTGELPGQFDSGEFSMEVNDKTQAGPAIRHQGGANVVFVDGHAETVKLPTIKRAIRGYPDVVVESWEAEYVDAGGTPVDPSEPTKTMEQLKLQRNPESPLIWSYLGRLHR